MIPRKTEKEYRGVIVDNQGIPVIGANVVEKGLQTELSLILMGNSR